MSVLRPILKTNWPSPTRVKKNPFGSRENGDSFQQRFLIQDKEKIKNTDSQEW